MVWRFAIPALAALAAFTASPVARAADFSPPPPMVVQPEASNWYLRGQIGVGVTNTFSLDFLENPAHTTNFVFDQHSNSDTVFVGAGFGYEWNNWLRFDFTGEYRNKTQVNARGVFNPLTGQGDAYQGYIKSWVFLANAYADLGTWNCFTPFVGFGVGGAYNQLADFVDMGIGTTGAGFGRNSADWHPAWALYAGVGYAVSKNIKVDLTYRYLNYGSVTDTVDCIGGCIPDSYRFGNLVSQDIMLGLRWNCCDIAPPPPRYEPLRSRG